MSRASSVQPRDFRLAHERGYCNPLFRQGFLFAVAVLLGAVYGFENRRLWNKRWIVNQRAGRGPLRLLLRNKTGEPKLGSPPL